MKSLTQKAKKLLLKLPTMSRTGDRDRQTETDRERESQNGTLPWRRDCELILRATEQGRSFCCCCWFRLMLQLWIVTERNNEDGATEGVAAMLFCAWRRRSSMELRQAKESRRLDLSHTQRMFLIQTPSRPTTNVIIQTKLNHLQTQNIFSSFPNFFNYWRGCTHRFFISFFSLEWAIWLVHHQYFWNIGHSPT
jgi:hypothetical protein